MTIKPFLARIIMNGYNTKIIILCFGFNKIMWGDLKKDNIMNREKGPEEKNREKGSMIKIKVLEGQEKNKMSRDKTITQILAQIIMNGYTTKIILLYFAFIKIM